jgi:hypothetical protein
MWVSFLNNSKEIINFQLARNYTLEYTDNQNRVHTERVFGDDKLVGPAIGFKDCGKTLGETDVKHVDNTGQQDRCVPEKPGDTSTYVGDQGDELLDAATLYQVYKELLLTCTCTYNKYNFIDSSFVSY